MGRATAVLIVALLLTVSSLWGDEFPRTHYGEANTLYGYSVAVIGDVSNPPDGIDDYMIGKPYTGAPMTQQPHAGSAYLLCGRTGAVSYTHLTLPTN